MSFGPAGQSGAYTPPPPADVKRGRSPWFYVGIGCGLILLLLVGSCAAFSVKVASMMNQPFNVQQEVQKLGVPAYPGAQVDETQSKAGRATLQIMKGAMKATQSTVVAFRTDDLSGEVFAFYDNSLNKAGFKQVRGGAQARANQHMYVNAKSRSMVMVQVQDSPGEKGERTIVVMRFDGMPEETLRSLEAGGAGG